MVLAALAAALVVASCSGTGDDDTGESTVESTVATTQNEPTMSSPPVTQLSSEVLEELGSLAPPTAGGESTGPLGSIVLELDTGDGTVQIGQGEVPESLQALPVPDDLAIQLASETDDAAGFTGLSTRSVDDLATFFREGLESAGYRITREESPSPTVVLFTFESDDGSGDVALSEAPANAGTTVVVTFSPSR